MGGNARNGQGRDTGNQGGNLTLSRGRPLSYRNQSIDLHSKSMDWFLYDNDFRLERIKHSGGNGIE